MITKLTYSTLQRGATVLFDQQGPVSFVLSGVLGLVDSDWLRMLRKPWHVGFIVDKETILNALDKKQELADHINWDVLNHPENWWICESLAGGITVNPVSIYDLRRLRFYRWHQRPQSREEDTKYLIDHIGLPYDPWVYLWTTIATILSKLFHLNIGVWTNPAFMCWENLEEYNNIRGKTLCTRYRTIMITDICRALGLM